MTDRLLTEYRSRLPLKHLAELSGAVRTSYYRRVNRRSRTVEVRRCDNRPLIARLHRICAQETGYGYRRVTLKLREQGHKINHKRVLRLMRQEKLLWRARVRFKGPATDSRHSLKVYPNLLETLSVRRLNQVWV